LMAEDDAKAAVVKADETVEGAFREAICKVVFPVFVAKKASAHHGCGGERDDHGNSNGNGECDGKFAEEAANDPWEKQNRNKNGDERGAHGKNGKADFAGALHGGGERFHAGFNVARDVFDNDDGVVHDETRRDGKGHEGEIVEAVAAEIHHAERANEGKRNGDAGNDGGPDVTEKNEDDKNDERNRDEQGDFDVVNRSADGGCAIRCDAEMKRRRDGSSELRHDRHDAVHSFDHVGAGLAEDGEDNGGFAEGEAEIAKVFDRIGDVGDVSQANGGADVAGDDERVIFVGFEELIRVGDGDGAMVVRERTFCEIGVGAAERGADLFEADAIAVDLIGIDADADGGARAAPREDLADAFDLREFLREDGIGSVVNFRGLDVRRGEREQKDGRVRGIYFAIAGLAGKIGGKLAAGSVNRGLDVAGGGVDVSIEIELENDAGVPVGARRSHLRDAGNVAEIALERGGNVGSHCFRARARKA